MNIFRYVVKNAKKYQAKNLFPYNIMLIGFMGSGKSTIAKYLSHILEMQDLETDEFIVKREDMTINEIFQRKGEEYFRRCENNLYYYKINQVSLDLFIQKSYLTNCYQRELLFVFLNFLFFDFLF